jgi:hypothetical protein
MLFDLRSRGRRRSVKVIYSGLALLMGLALVFLGLGGLGGGSLIESISKEGHGGGSSYAAKVTAAKKQIAKNPNDIAAWIALTEAQLHEASGSESYNSTTGAYTAHGKEQLRRAASSWSHYLALNPKPVSVRLAREVAVIFGAEGLDEPANAVQALQILVAANPNSEALYSELAEYSYLAHNERQGDLASKKAVALAPKAKRTVLEAELERVKRSVKEKSTAKTGGTAAGAATSTTTSATSSSAKKK